MTIQFNKFQGTGNDFVIVDGEVLATDNHNKLGQHDVRNICHRNFGIGADGFIVINPLDGFDFEMVYYNSDGNPSTMCGNGGRCAVAYAKRKGLIDGEANFMAVDGAHQASFVGEKISLQMQDVESIQEHETFYQLNTGSPHYVTFVDAVSDINVAQEGALIRNSPMFEADGINVNFVEERGDNQLYVRTYERGVEAETLSCGTGVTAAALVQMMRTGTNEVQVETPGGVLSVTADNNNNTFSNVRLIGDARFVFAGEITID